MRNRSLSYRKPLSDLTLPTLGVLLASILMLSGLSACDSPERKLDKAACLLGEHPDSAYLLLREIDYADFDTDSLRAKYILTKAMADNRVGRSLITDTLLEDAATYYFSVGDTTDWVVASQLMAGYDYIRGDADAALRRIDAMLPLLKNPGLLWDTHVRRLEISWGSQDYPGAYHHADWLFRHTDRPEQVLRFTAVKGGAEYMQGNARRGVEIYDSIIATGVLDKVCRELAADFYCDYAEMLDGAGRSAEAIKVLESHASDSGQLDEVDKIARNVSLAHFYANSGDMAKAKELLDGINHENTRNVFEIYTYIGMLKTAIRFKESGRFPSDIMRRVTKTVHRSHDMATFDRQTAMESVMELNEDKYTLRLQKQRLWLIISGITLLVVVSGVAVYIMSSRRRQRLVEAEERAETLARMLDEAEKAESGKAASSDREKLKAALLRQLGIFKTFAGTPTQQSRDALKKISGVAGGDGELQSLVDWQEFYAMIDGIYDGFHSRLAETYPGILNDKELQIVVLLKAGFSTKEIGVLTEQSSATIYVRKTSIRKKLNTPADGDFIAQLDSIFASV